MDTTFSYGVRLLMCSNCGAPLQVAPAGGTVPCQYCGTANQVATRDERPLATMVQHPVPNEPERIARLRAQDGKPLLPPASLAPLFGPGGQIPPYRMQEVLAVWQTTRNELRTTGSFDAAERLLFLTLALSNQFSAANDAVRQRAMLESAYEVFNLPRHRQMMLGMLSRNACKTGDLASAERWLGLCDPQPEDLESDSSYRLSYAFLATARQNWNGVLAAVGPNNTDVPIMDTFDALAAVLRANAWERLGQLPGAVAVLQDIMHRVGAMGRQAIEQILASLAQWQLCPASFPQATAQYAVEAAGQAAASQGGGVAGFLFILGILMLLGAAAAIIAGAAGGGMMGYSWALGPGIAGVVMILVAAPMRAAAKKAQHLRLHGRLANGRILGLQPTGTLINNVPQYRLMLQIELDGVAPYQATTKLLMHAANAARLQPGAVVPVRVDPAQPQDVILESD